MLKRAVIGEKVNRRQCARVVKGFDSKSNGFSRAGSNPAIVGFFTWLFNSNY